MEGASAMRKRSEAVRICSREGRSGQTVAVKRGKGNIRSRELGVRN